MLSESQKELLKKFALTCGPVEVDNQEDLQTLINLNYVGHDAKLGFVHLKDRGMCEAVVKLGITFGDVIANHKSLNNRFDSDLQYAKSANIQGKDLDALFFARFAQFIAYDGFNENGQFRNLSMSVLRKLNNDIFLMLAENPNFAFEKVLGLMGIGKAGAIIPNREALVFTLKQAKQFA